MKKIIVLMFFALSALSLASGCSSDDSTPAPSTLSGTAATGAPIDGTVTVKDANGVEKDIATGTGGSFTLDVAGMTPPYLLKIMPSDGTATLYSYATEIGQTVNLTSTTNLAMFIASGKTDLDAMYGAWDGTAVSAAAVATAEGTVRANLLTQMEAAGLDVAGYDLFTTAFSADGTGIDAVMDDLIITIDAGATLGFTFTDGSGADLGFDESAVPPAPPAPAGAVSIITVTGAQHALDGTYKTGCYVGETGASQFDSLTANGAEWVIAANVYSTPGCTGSTPAVSTITVTASKGVDKQISGWVQGPGVAPMKADGSGQLSDTETVTEFTLSNISVADLGGAFGGFTTPAPGTTFTGFYVFDDTAAGFVMYRDDDGDFASVSDPYITK